MNKQLLDSYNRLEKESLKLKANKQIDMDKLKRS